MCGSVNDLISFWCGHFQRQQQAHYVTAPELPPYIPLRDTIIFLARSKRFSPHENDPTRQPAVLTTNYAYWYTVPWLSSSRSERRVYCVVANRSHLFLQVVLFKCLPHAGGEHDSCFLFFSFGSFCLFSFGFSI